MTAAKLWHKYCEEKKIDETTPYEAWSFGGEDDAKNELLKRVLCGCKFGTASAYDEYVEEGALEDLPKVGDYSVLLWANGEAACVIKNYDVYIRSFETVPPFHAYAEGEGDRSLNAWKEIHTKFFAPRLKAINKPLNPKSLIVCEKFTVEYTAEHGAGKSEELIFVEPSMTCAEEISAYREEMIMAESSFDGCLSMRRMPDPKEYVEYCTEFANPSRVLKENGARGTVLLCIRKSDNKMVGCMQVHHVLNEQMKNITGHVGYSVRPSERRKGYATKMLEKAKDYLGSFGFSEIYLSCLPENEASRRTILANGGEYIETVYLEADEVNLERYKILRES
ncbi:MAG: GNAT family N-acetyltransferase [Lachnospiraceae bacterium]|nr:GNAT family N-acetyltransferase [Lachnospiraceae bacterium]